MGLRGYMLVRLNCWHPQGTCRAQQLQGCGRSWKRGLLRTSQSLTSILPGPSSALSLSRSLALKGRCSGLNKWIVRYSSQQEHGDSLEQRLGRAKLGYKHTVLLHCTLSLPVGHPTALLSYPTVRSSCSGGPGRGAGCPSSKRFRNRSRFVAGTTKDTSPYQLDLLYPRMGVAASDDSQTRWQVSR